MGRSRRRITLHLATSFQQVPAKDINNYPITEPPEPFFTVASPTQFVATIRTLSMRWQLMIAMPATGIN